MPPKPTRKVTTRSKASKQQREEISRASGSSPPKGTRKKPLQFQSPAVTGITPQVVTVTKRAKSGEESSRDGNSTGSENASVTMASNLTANADPRLDKQLDHVLEEFLFAKGGSHKIRQMFKKENINQSGDFVGYKVEHLEDLQRKLHNTT